MEKNFSVLAYFNYDLEKLLDEFNHYYTIKYSAIPIYFRTIFLYFSNLSEISLQELIHSQFDVHKATILEKILPAHKQILTPEIVFRNMRDTNLPAIHYANLFRYCYFFYELFLTYIQTEQERNLIVLASQMPIIEYNLNLVAKVTKSSHKRA